MTCPPKASQLLPDPSRSGYAGGAGAVVPGGAVFEREITVTAGDVELAGHLAIPDRAAGAVIFAHGGGSSRRSPATGSSPPR